MYLDSFLGTFLFETLSCFFFKKKICFAQCILKYMNFPLFQNNSSYSVLCRNHSDYLKRGVGTQ